MWSWVSVIGRFKVIPLMVLRVVLRVGLRWFPWWCYGWVIGDFIGGLKSVFLVVFKIALASV